MKHQNDSIGQQMKNIANQVPRSKMFQLPSLLTIGHDGVDHINIWESGDTNLGKALSSFTALPFEHDEYGSFVSIEGFWHYIRSVSKDDNLRLLSGHNARTFGRTLESSNVKDIYFIMADANWQKIRSYPALIKEIKDLRMPFDSYYLEEDKDKVKPKHMRIRARSLNAKWLVPAFHEIHEAVHQNREPDFTFLKDENRDGIAKVSHPLVMRESTHGGFNSNLFYMYSKKPVQNKPKQTAVLTQGENVKPKKDKPHSQQDHTGVKQDITAHHQGQGVLTDNRVSMHEQNLLVTSEQGHVSSSVNEGVEPMDKLVRLNESDSQALSEERDNHATN